MVWNFARIKISWVRKFWWMGGGVRKIFGISSEFLGFSEKYSQPLTLIKSRTPLPESPLIIPVDEFLALPPFQLMRLSNFCWYDPQFLINQFLTEKSVFSFSLKHFPKINIFGFYCKFMYGGLLSPVNGTCPLNWNIFIITKKTHDVDFRL